MSENMSAAQAAQEARFSYVKYDDESQALQAELKRRFVELATFVEEKIYGSRSKALIFTELEVAYMWTGKAIRDAQLHRNPIGTVEQPERNNE